MTHCPNCNFEFPSGLTQYPQNCPRCGVPLHVPYVAAPPQPKRQINYAFFWRSPTMYIIAICFVMFAVELAMSRTFEIALEPLVRLGALNGGLVFAGEWWRMITAVFLHGDIFHIGFNMWALFNLGILAELLYGRRNYTILFLLCGLGGSALSIFWHPESVGVGASGAIFGIAGALLPALKFQKNPRVAAALRGSYRSIGLFVIYNLLFGAAIPFIDNSAHLGGLITGAIAGYFLPQHTVEEERLNTTRAVVVFVIAFAVVIAFAYFANDHHMVWPSRRAG